MTHTTETLVQQYTTYGCWMGEMPVVEADEFGKVTKIVSGWTQVAAIKYIRNTNPMKYENIWAISITEGKARPKLLHWKEFDIIPKVEVEPVKETKVKPVKETKVKPVKETKVKPVKETKVKASKSVKPEVSRKQMVEALKPFKKQHKHLKLNATNAQLTEWYNMYCKEQK